MASKLVEFRLYDFNEYNKVIEEDNDSDQENKSYTDKKEYYIQMFGAIIGDILFSHLGLSILDEIKG